MEAEYSFPEITIFSDGGAEPNPGRGGFGVVMLYKEYRKEFKQGYSLTTNNRMELMGVIFALEQIKKKSIINVYTDSQYVVNGITKGWAQNWKNNNWNRSKSEKAINSDLWDRLLILIETHVSVSFHWIKGHAGHPENERCDELANQALNGSDLMIDEGYTNSSNINPEGNPYVVKVVAQATKNKITNEGDSCRKCDTPVIKKQPKKKKLKDNQEYYFEYYLLCPKCKTMYMVDKAKRYTNPSGSNSLF